MKLSWLITLTVTMLISSLTVSAQNEKFEQQQREWQEKIDARYRAWLREKDPQKKDELRDEISQAIIHYDLFDRHELLDQLAAGGKFFEGEIKMPSSSAAVVTLQKIREFGDSADYGIDYSYGRGWGIRRMTEKHFELWSPKQGWLFAADGQLLNTARMSREGLWDWYGAFLADGSWVTTNLEKNDGKLHFYSRAGKRLRSVGMGKLINAPAGREYVGIEWCRAAADGKSYVLSDSEHFEPKTWHYRDGKIRELAAYRRKCYPRDLEPRRALSTIWYVTESDDGDALLTREEKTHGATVGFSDYSIGGIIGDGTNYHKTSCFGFWPDSKNVYINAGRNKDIDFRRRGDMCWFFRADGRFAGWVKAARLADADDGESMLFDAGKGKVVTISGDFKVTQAQKFRWADGGIAFPEKIFPDLKLGFFWEGKELVLARWR